MANPATAATLASRIAEHRARAAHARRLARQIADKRAAQGLLQFAGDLERQIAELEAQLAILNQAAQAAEPARDRAALKPPTDKPGAGN